MMWVCILANSIILVFTYRAQNAIFLKYAFNPAHPHLATAFTSMFLHAGILHLVGNCFFLWMFGRQVENWFGHIGFSIVYLASGLGGAALHYWINVGSNIPTVGASGAISGVAGAYFVLFPASRFDLQFYLGWFKVGSTHTRTQGAIGSWFAEQLVLGLIAKGAGIAFWAHVGGFATGLIIAYASRILFAGRLSSDVRIKDYYRT
jgi:membrane associated rhomboid family serine protease